MTTTTSEPKRVILNQPADISIISKARLTETSLGSAKEKLAPVKKVEQPQQPKMEPALPQTQPPPPPMTSRPIVPPVTNLPSGVVLPTTPLQPQQLNCSIRPHKMPATAATVTVQPPQVVLQTPQPQPQQQQVVAVPKQSNPPNQTYPSSVSPTTIQAMLASVKPVVSMAQMVSGRSTLRNYRRAKNAVPEPTKADTSNGNKTIQSVIGSRTLPSDISVTPVLTKSSTVSNDIKRQIEHQPPSVSCYPIGREVVEKTQEMSIDDLMAAKKLKDEQHPGSGPSQQNNRSFQLPKGLTITEISSKSEKPASEKPPVNYEVQALPVLHIPDVPTGISTASKGDRHFDLLKKFDEASSGTGGDKRPVPSSKPSNGIVGGHPGMPNGLLRMTASLQQKSDYSRPGIGRIQTKVTPKDLKSQQALDKIEMLQFEKNGSQSNQSQPPQTNCGSTITVSMAQSAASAVSFLGSKPVPKIKNRNKPPSHQLQQPHQQQLQPQHQHQQLLQQSPASSQPSSRNSSISPRDRSGSFSGSGKSSASFRQSPSLTSGSKFGAGEKSSQVSPKPVYRPNSIKKKLGPSAGPLIPWSKRGGGPPKHSNGWSWLGEGAEQLVYLNVSET